MMKRAIRLLAFSGVFAGASVALALPPQNTAPDQAVAACMKACEQSHAYPNCQSKCQEVWGSTQYTGLLTPRECAALGGQALFIPAGTCKTNVMCFAQGGAACITQMR